MKRIAIFGSTGSIGASTLQVIRENPADFRAVTLVAGKNIERLILQINEFAPENVYITSEENAARISALYPHLRVYFGEDGMEEISNRTDFDVAVSALVGIAGLAPTYNMIKNGKTVALANKEVLVAGGELVMNAAKESGAVLLTVDSEHSAIFQCLRCGSENAAHPDTISRILLTASGGPFFGKTRAELENVTLGDALKHPTWAMGAKITIDSATLMNKGLEILEAKWLFDTEIDDIEVVVHRESIIHSAVEFVDKSVIAQMSLPSMKHPIQYAFTYPERLPSKDEPLDLKKLSKLTFFEPDEEAFPLLALAKKAGKLGGIMPTVLNAANENAVYAFLGGRLKFNEISDYVEKTMSEYKNIENPSLSDIIETDKSVREQKI